MKKLVLIAVFASWATQFYCKGDVVDMSSDIVTISNLIVGVHGSTNRGILQMIGGGTSDEGTTRYFTVHQYPGGYVKPEQLMRVLADNSISLLRSTKVTGEFEATGNSTFSSLVTDSLALDNGTLTSVILFGLDNVLQFANPMNISINESRALISTNGIWVSNALHTAGMKLNGDHFEISFDEVPVITLNTNNSISVSNSVMANFFVGQYYGNGLTVTNIPGSNIFGQISNALTRSNDWLGTFTGSAVTVTNLTAGTIGVSTFNVNTLNATNFIIRTSGWPPSVPDLATNDIYLANSNGILHTITLTDAGWTTNRCVP